MIYVPIVQIKIETNTMNSSPKVPPLLPVACAYTTAIGKDPLLFVTASRSEIAYITAIA